MAKGTFLFACALAIAVGAGAGILVNLFRMVSPL